MLRQKILNRSQLNIFASKLHTANPRISPLGAYIFLIFLDGGLYEGGAYKRGRTYEIIVDIKKTLLKDLVYFSRDFFMSI